MLKQGELTVLPYGYLATAIKETLTQDRHSLHTSLVAAVEERRIKDLPSSVKDPAGFCKVIGNNQACDKFLTIINSIFKE